MARPKKFKVDTEVISFRIPKGMKDKIKKAVDDMFNTGKAIVHQTEKGNITVVDQFSETGEIVTAIAAMEDELKLLDPTKGTFARQRIQFCEKRIKTLKESLPKP